MNMISLVEATSSDKNLGVSLPLPAKAETQPTFSPHIKQYTKYLT